MKYDIEFEYYTRERINTNLYLTTYKFICPCCNNNIVIEVEDFSTGTNIFMTHDNHNHNRECMIAKYIETDFYTLYKIRNIEEYKQKLLDFFNSDEYTTIIKQGLLKEL